MFCREYFSAYNMIMQCFTSTYPKLEFERVVQNAFDLYYCSDYTMQLNQTYWNRGCCRRLSSMIRCYVRIFALFPEGSEIPEEELSKGTIEDISIYFNSFLINWVGFLDDLALLINSYMEKPQKEGAVSFKGKKFLSQVEKENVRLHTAIKEFKNEHSRVFDLRNRVGHRLAPYFVSTLETENDEKEYAKLMTLYNDSLPDIDEASDIHKKANSYLKYRGRIGSDPDIASENTILIMSVHLFLIDELNALVEFTKEAILALRNVPFRATGLYRIDLLE